MNKENIIVLKYQENFADNLSLCAYGKILENETQRKCFFENNSKKRENFENFMANFKMDYNYISTARIENITKKSYLLSRLYINDKQIHKEISKKRNSNSILNLKYFKIDDIKHLSNEITSGFKFNNTSFIQNFDILEEITNTQSIGLFINPKDLQNNEVDYNYITNATKRLNKYIKKPKLYIFSDLKVNNKINSYIDFKIYNLKDWREEFYFLKNCKHKIILNSTNSYSEGLWSAILNQKDYSINIYDKKLKVQNKYDNWIGV